MNVSPLSVSVVLVVYNEATTIVGAVEEVCEALTGRDFEVIIVDDGSTDDTPQVCDQATARLPNVRVIHQPTNAGIGAVWRIGLREVKNEIVVFLAGDGQPIPESYFGRCLPLFESADIVLGSVEHRSRPLLSRFFSSAERWILWLLFPGVPKIEGPMLFRRSILEGLRLHHTTTTERRWILAIEILVRAVRAGHVYSCTTVRRRTRAAGRSKANTWRNAFWMTFLLLQLRLIILFESGRRSGG